jgi:hypothetical protein
VDWTDLAHDIQLAVSSENSNDPSISVKGEKLFDYLNDLPVSQDGFWCMELVCFDNRHAQHNPSVKLIMLGFM